MLPFAALLLTIAVAPVVASEKWHRHSAKICAGFAAITVAYYIGALRSPWRVVHAGWEYGSFIIVVGGFFVVAAGIHLQVRGRATPALNTLFLFVGALLGNVLGTVAASILLIRPWIAVNRSRVAPFHIAFFIFVVSNIGGVLLPIGPPLLLGYLQGVPFWWVAQRCWAPWTIILAAVLLAFYVFDRLNFRRSVAEIAPAAEKWRLSGGLNFLVMGAILACLVILPAGWRESSILVIAPASYWFTPAEIRQRNEFSFAPLKEIAWIFLGIFGTMMPVLDYMEKHAASLGLRSDAQFFWTTGSLSAVLDNAPAYLTFLAAALGLHGLSIDQPGDISQFLAQHDHSLIAISLGATCFGALTYIGNGPNLLVKAMADHAGARTPGFFGFIFKFALPILLPIFALIWFLFFR
ncbi:MAG TPA: sodium:proton antiporter [Chthoniobacterales bacterium]|nr:sodium:proton antiporter [Chthoniobacterales bacterium]